MLDPLSNTLPLTALVINISLRCRFPTAFTGTGCLRLVHCQMSFCHAMVDLGSGYPSSLTKSITVLPDGGNSNSCAGMTGIAGTLAEAVNARKKLVLLKMSTDI
ncbi:hypothetical protein Tco_1391669 [Tanacetum coccineum]